MMQCYVTIISKDEPYKRSCVLSRKHLIDVDTVLHHTKTIHGWCDESKLDELRSFDFVESVEVDKRRPVLALPVR